MAATLLRGAWEISGDLETLKQLAQVQAMTGQFDEAVENYEEILRRKPSPSLAQVARDEVRRLKNAPAPFSDQLLATARASDEAREAFKAGMALFKRKQLQPSIQFLRAALVLDPMMPGTYRVLGAIYGKLGDPAKEQAFLQDYLRIRPDGPIAASIRKRLKPTGLLNDVTLSSSFPCEVWINGRPLDQSTPIASILLPSGNHTISFVSSTYHIIRNMRIRLGTGRKQQVTFSFGVLELKLKPWARIRADGRDLGLWDTIGLPVGDYLISLTAHDNSRSKQERVLIERGKVKTISTW